MYGVIGHPKSRTLRVLWMLEELDQPYEATPAPPRSEAVSKVSGAGKIPVLVVDGVAVTDSIAILTFLADRHGALTSPAGTLDRARQDALTQMIVEEVDGALWTAAKHRFALPEALRIPAAKETARHEFAEAMTRLAALVADGWLMGEAFLVPDLVLAHCAGWARSAGFEVPDAVDAHMHRAQARPAFAAVREKHLV